MAEPEQIRGGEQTLEQRVDRIEKFVADFALGASISDVPVYLFEGGRMPQPQTDGAVGYDCYARAIQNRQPTTL
jgi:hypothetical protein